MPRRGSASPPPRAAAAPKAAAPAPTPAPAPAAASHPPAPVAAAPTAVAPAAPAAPAQPGLMARWLLQRGVWQWDLQLVMWLDMLSLECSVEEAVLNLLQQLQHLLHLLHLLHLVRRSLDLVPWRSDSLFSAARTSMTSACVMASMRLSRNASQGTFSIK